VTSAIEAIANVTQVARKTRVVAMGWLLTLRETLEPHEYLENASNCKASRSGGISAFPSGDPSSRVAH
jgi:hypothetical protein